MTRVRSRDTTPELFVRRIAHRLGYRFRLHRKDLPGRPDLTFPRHRAVIFVHGCFWHRHDCRKGATEPVANAEFWRAKRERNVARDREAQARLGEMDWRVLTVWECELKNPGEVEATIAEFLGPGRNG